MGASRGLGWATYQELNRRSETQAFLLSSRKINARKNQVSANTELVEQDYSVTPVGSDFLTRLQDFNPTCLIYFAGGGPYGLFADKKWNDHDWALKTSFLYPAELLHAILSKRNEWKELKKILFVGSAIAEDQADPKAASYAAAKHAVKGLGTSIQAEVLDNQNPQITLFSPGYMQTELLPVNSQPRQNQLALDPVDVAKKLIAIIEKND